MHPLLMLLGRALDAISLTGWSDFSITSPSTQGTTEDRTLTWSVGGARNISLSGYVSVVSVVEYRINSGSWVTYSTPFSVSSGQTVGFRATTPGNNGSETVTVTDAARSATIDTFQVTVSGF